MRLGHAAAFRRRVGFAGSGAGGGGAGLRPSPILMAISCRFRA